MHTDLIKKASNLLNQKITYIGDLNFSTDSRNLGQANAFICLYGERFDAFNFIESLLDEKLDMIFYEDRPGRKEILSKLNTDHVELVAVKNVYDFLLEIGSINSKQFQKSGGKVIGLTGSNGKTTNKEMLASLLNGIAPNKVLWTKGNLNNHIGVPLTLLRLNSDLEYAIVEMGTNHPGEIAVLAKAAKPTHAMITNIGHAHLENLINLEGVFAEKTALFKEVEKNTDGFILVNHFDDYLKSYIPRCRTEKIDESSLEILDDGLRLTFKEKEYEVKNKSLFGKHQKVNMSQCLSMALELCPEKATKLIELANSFSMPSMNRGEVIECGNKKIFLDAYNANPDSMRASLLGFVELMKAQSIEVSKCIFILGDMNELGSCSEAEHEKLGTFLKELGAVKAGFVGRFAKSYVNGFGLAESFTCQEKVGPWLSATEAPFAFIKGSRSLQLESILDIKGK